MTGVQLIFPSAVSCICLAPVFFVQTIYYRGLINFVKSFRSARAKGATLPPDGQDGLMFRRTWMSERDLGTPRQVSAPGDGGRIEESFE